MRVFVAVGLAISVVVGLALLNRGGTTKQRTYGAMLAILFCGVVIVAGGLVVWLIVGDDLTS